jgi:hypothetical protein
MAPRPLSAPNKEAAAAAERSSAPPVDSAEPPPENSAAPTLAPEAPQSASKGTAAEQPAKAQAVAPEQAAPTEAARAEAAQAQATEWTVSRGSTLRRTLERWGRTASREIVYQLPEDMAVDVDGRFEGTFDEALAWLLRGFDSARPRPIARVRSNAVLIQGSKDDLGGEARS